MKIIGLEDTEEINKKLNKRKLVITIAIIVTIVLAIVLVAAYIANRGFRDFVDFNIFRKAVTENNVKSIQIDENQNNIFAYDKYIAILRDNVLTHYNSSGKEESKIDVKISNPVTDTNNRFLLIGEKDKQKLYLISNGDKVWEKDDIEGNITRVCVNKNGYSAVIISGTTYKSVIEIFDSTGKKIFTTYLSNSTAMDVDISFDNKYMSFAEISTNGTVVSSVIKTISIEKAKENPTESIVNTYEAKTNSLILNIKYQEGNGLVCMYDNAIYMLKDGNEEEIINLQEDSKNNFADIELLNYAVRVIDKSAFFNSQNSIEMINVNNKKVNIYTLDGVAKQIYCYDANVAINLGAEVHFIGTNGWLIKKYTSSQEIKNIVMCSNFAGIVYRDKIEIVNL